MPLYVKQYVRQAGNNNGSYKPINAATAVRKAAKETIPCSKSPLLLKSPGSEVGVWAVLARLEAGICLMGVAIGVGGTNTDETMLAVEVGRPVIAVELIPRITVTRLLVGTGKLVAVTLLDAAPVVLTEAVAVAVAAAVVVAPALVADAEVVYVTPVLVADAEAVVVAPALVADAEVVYVTPVLVADAEAVVVTPALVANVKVVVVTPVLVANAEVVVVPPALVANAEAVVVTPVLVANAEVVVVPPALVANAEAVVEVPDAVAEIVSSVSSPWAETRPLLRRPRAIVRKVIFMVDE
ncbi:hypothetical protein DFJ77DRAFT_505975 [Powellomyces hirtus]|nr:hypothetical protein DFJ77DRAFT_505975 [Powellomyces hirtus]